MAASERAGQGARILAALRGGRTLTALDALRDFGTIRLPSRIHELRRAGHPILSEPVEVARADGSMVRVARYRLGPDAPRAEAAP